VEALDESPEIGGEVDDKCDIFTMVSQIPETRCEVVIHTTSNTWWPHAITKSEEKAESIDLDSSTSVLESTFSESTRDHAFTMSERSLDSDHSGPEFEEIKVEPKLTRSSPLKSIVRTPTKALKTRNSSTSLHTPKSVRKSRDASDQSTPTPAEEVQQTHENISAVRKTNKAHAKSPFFSPPASAEKPKVSADKKPRVKGGLVSCIPFPPLRSASFGLLQEKLSQDPFRLLVGVTFLNRTMGKCAIPVFFSLMERYPTPADILTADKEDIISMTQHLGLQAQRAETYKKFAHFWIHDPPVKGKRYRVDHYPEPGDGMDIKAGEVIDDEDPRVAWEIGHMTKGRYAIDSWRIFCRDILRGEAEGWNGEGREDGFQPEWMRVQPRDKELIACLRWMWLKEGFSWDPVTGEKEVADRELMEAAIAGKIAWDDQGGMRIIEDDGNADEDIRVKAENEVDIN
jgi:methyl-CpG-binding domain protein 4